MQAVSAGRPKVRLLQQPPDHHRPNVVMPGRVIPRDGRQPFHPVLMIMDEIRKRGKPRDTAGLEHQFMQLFALSDGQLRAAEAGLAAARRDSARTTAFAVIPDILRDLFAA